MGNIDMFGIITLIVMIVAIIGLVVARTRSHGANPLWPMGLIAKLAFAAVMLGGLALAVTGLGTRALLGRALSEYTLMLHMCFSGAFAVGLAALALLWAGRLRWTTDGEQAPAGCVLRLSFWVLVLTGLLAGLSMGVAMLPVFGTEAQEVLIVIHRYSALGVAASGVWLAGLVMKNFGQSA